MIACQEFRRTFAPATDDARLLEHLRACDDCLDFAAHVDADVMFRALGGEMVPPGGVDAFVGDVMRQVQIRSAENSMAVRREAPAQGRWALAAALAVTIAGSSYVWHLERQSVTVPGAVATKPPVIRPLAQPASLTTKPAVESYQSAEATIVEVPGDESSDVKVVMIFDDSLPADL